MKDEGIRLPYAFDSKNGAELKRREKTWYGINYFRFDKSQKSTPSAEQRDDARGVLDGNAGEKEIHRGDSWGVFVLGFWQEVGDNWRFWVTAGLIRCYTKYTS